MNQTLYALARAFETAAERTDPMAGLKRICKAHGGMKVIDRDGNVTRYDKDGNIMPLKPRVKVKAKGIPIGNFEVIKDVAGKSVVKPKRKHKTLQQEYASRSKKRYKGVAK